jgi:hypothetical protein
MAVLVALACSGCTRSAPPAAAGNVESRPSAGTPAPSQAKGGGQPVTPSPAAPRTGALPRTWDDYRRQAAKRMVAVNHDISHNGVVVEPLLAIPVLEIEVNADGSVKRIHVLRKPHQALDTVQLAIDAVQRAAPFGPVTHLPRPWKFNETFLFDEQRRFKPSSLDR